MWSRRQLPNITLLQTLTVWNTDGCTERYHARIYLCFTFAALLQLVSMCVCTVSGCRVRDGGLCDRIILGEDSLRLPAAGRTTRLPEVSIITYNLNCDKLIQFSMDVCYNLLTTKTAF